MSRTVLVRLLVSSSAYLDITLMRSSPYFCGQWQASQVSRAGRRLCTGVGIGRGYVLNVTASNCLVPDSLLCTNQLAPGPKLETYSHPPPRGGGGGAGEIRRRRYAVG